MSIFRSSSEYVEKLVMVSREYTVDVTKYLISLLGGRCRNQGQDELPVTCSVSHFETELNENGMADIPIKL